jgi:hypothetical protein
MSKRRAGIAQGLVLAAVVDMLACGGGATQTVLQPAPGRPAPPATQAGPLRGWVDLHAHPMSYLGFGGKAIPGGVDVGIPLPADAQCHRWVTPTTIEQVLGNDRAIHGGWSLDHLCGDVLRSILVTQWEAAQGYGSVSEPKPGSADGAPTYEFWPAWTDMLHQKMWIDWVRRAWENGQRVMVALADHDDTTAHAFSGPGDGPNDDKASLDLQTQWMKAFVARHPEFMQIALSSAQLRDIVRANKMAVVLGAEIDSIGNFNSDPEVMACEDLPDVCAARAKAKVSAEIQRLYEEGIRYLFPIHVVDNVFGGTAVYTGIFNLANEFTYGSAWDLECASADEGILYDGGFGMTPGVEQVLRVFVLAKMFRGFDIPDPPKCPPGKIGVHNKRGLTKLGEFALHEMMRHGMLIDIDHMAEHAADRALELAEAVPQGGYPLMAGHSAVRGKPPHNAPYAATNGRSEMQHTPRQLARIAKLHGMFGLGNAAIPAQEWIKDYADAVALVPDLGAISFGTDLDGMVVGSPPSPGSHVVYTATFPMSSLGGHSWDYNKVGVAHYGMLADFLADARNGSGVDAADIIDHRIFAGAAYFEETWFRAEQRAASVPAEGPETPAVQLSTMPACASACCDACAVCATKGIAGGTCTACKGCQKGCACAAVPAPTAASTLASAPSPMDIGTAKTACDGGEALECHTVGAAYESGQGVSEDMSEARRFFQRACDLKRVESCVHLGRIFEEGAGALVDASEAAVFFRRACDLHDPEGCHRLGGLLAEGPPGVPRNDREATAVEGRACDTGFRQACMALAAMHKQGRTGVKDRAAATKVYERMCARGDRYGCQRTQGAAP